MAPSIHPATGPGLSRDSTHPGEHVVFDYLPGSREDYTAVERRLVRCIDWTLMPVLISMIVLNYLDRNALPNARIQEK